MEPEGVGATHMEPEGWGATHMEPKGVGRYSYGAVGATHMWSPRGWALATGYTT